MQRFGQRGLCFLLTVSIPEHCIAQAVRAGAEGFPALPAAQPGCGFSAKRLNTSLFQGLLDAGHLCKRISRNTVASPFLSLGILESKVLLFITWLRCCSPQLGCRANHLQPLPFSGCCPLPYPTSCTAIGSTESTEITSVLPDLGVLHRAAAPWAGQRVGGVIKIFVVNGRSR